MTPPKRRRAEDEEESKMASSIKDIAKNQKEMSKQFEERMNRLEEKLSRDDDKKKIVEKTFVLKHTFKKVLDMEEGSQLTQPSQEHFGRKWYVYIERNDENLSVYLATEEPKATGEWSIQTDQELEIVFGTDSILSKLFGTMDNEGDSLGLQKFVSWEEMKRCYLENGELTVQARVKILNMTGIVKPKVFHFDESNKKHSDSVLKVGNEKFHVWKGFLSRHSHFFDALFSKNFKEGQPETKEIELPETDAQDFQNFLEVLHGDTRPDDYTVEGILHLNDVYHAKNVLRECEDFLIYKSEKTLRKMLELSSRYQLNALADECVSEITPDVYKSLVEDGFVQEAGLYVSRALNKRSVTFF